MRTALVVRASRAGLPRLIRVAGTEDSIAGVAVTLLRPDATRASSFEAAPKAISIQYTEQDNACEPFPHGRISRETIISFASVGAY